MATAITKTFEDIRYTVTMIPSEYHVDFTAYSIVGVEAETTRPLYWPYGASTAFPGTTDPNQAEWLVRGSIKWDGCSDLEFNSEDCAIHLCGPTDAIEIGVLLGRVYEMAREAMGARASWPCHGSGAEGLTVRGGGGWIGRELVIITRRVEER